MTDRIAHRGPDAERRLDPRGRPGRRSTSATGGCRSSTCPPPPTSRSSRTAWPRLQRRALQLPGAAGRAGRPRRPLPHARPTPRSCSRPGAAGARPRCPGSAACSRSRCSTSATGELVLARDPFGIKPLYYLRRGDGAAVRLRAEGAGRRGRPRAADRAAARWSRRCSTTGCPSSAARSRASRKLPGRLAGPGCARTARCQVEHYWQVADVAARGRRRRRAPTCAGSSRSRSPPTWSPTCRCPASCPAAWTPASSPCWPHRADPEIDAYTITFRPEDQRLEAMPDDAVYARKVAAQFGVKLHEIEISPDIVDLLPRMVDALDEPIGDPAAINTLLMCQAARERGVKVLLSGHGRRRAVRRLPQAPGLPAGRRLPAGCPAPGAGRPSRPRCDRLPVAVGRPRAALRAVGQALPDLRRAARGGRVPAQLHAVRPGRAGRRCSSPDLAGHVDRCGRRAPRDLQRQRPGRRREPDVPGRRAAVPARAQPGLHRPVQHGRLDRGSRPVRGPGGGSGRVRHPGPRQDPRAGRARWPSSRPRRPGCPQEIVYRPKASFSAPLRAWVAQRPAGRHRRRARPRRARRSPGCSGPAR